MGRMVTIAAIQLPDLPPLAFLTNQRERNLGLAEFWLEIAGRQGAGIACLAEMVTTLGIPLTKENIDRAVEPSPDQLVERFGKLARRFQMYIIAPCLCRVEGVLRNVALVIDRGGLLQGMYFKVHCTQAERALGIVPGDDFPVFQLDFGTIGIQTCHDNSFPESARCLMLNGAEIIFWPHVMSGWGDEFMRVLMCAPAIHNGIVHVPVCYGCPPGQAWMPGMMIGHSSIIRPDGTTLVDAGRDPGVALGVVDLDQQRLAGSFTRDDDSKYRPDMLIDRRPDTYGSIIRR